jgi:hypothetical protein
VHLADGRSLYDVLSDGYTLLRQDSNADISALVDAAASRRVPLSVLDLSGADARAVFDHALTLVRADHHVAWRGRCVPAGAVALVDRLRGARV